MIILFVFEMKDMIPHLRRLAGTAGYGEYGVALLHSL